MTNQKDLLKLFKTMTGTPMYVPKKRTAVQPWQESKVKYYAFKERL